MVIKYEKRRSYGRDRYYILNAKFQKSYALLTGLSTLTEENIKLLEDMEIKFELVDKS